MAILRLISFDICTNVQRSTIALQEKGVAYDLEYIDLKNKPDWFVALSPHGKVPVLQVNDTALFESTVILEYLDETLEPRLHPEDPLARARDRAWFSVADALATDMYHLMIAPDHPALAQRAAEAADHLGKLNNEVEGPLWRGQRFSAMDAVAYPALQRIRWLAALYPQLGLFEAAPRALVWAQTLEHRPSIVASTMPDIHERFLQALRGLGAVHRT